MKSMQKNMVAILALTVAAAGYAEEQRANVGRGESSHTNAWRMQVGWVHQWGRGMTVRGSAPSFLPGGPSLSGAPGLANTGVFDDGYVLPDRWTGDMGVPAERQGMTWNWGADNASQYNYDGGVHPTLSFHKNQGSFVGASYSIRGGNSDDDLPTDGIEIKASRLLHSWTCHSGPTNASNEKVFLDMSVVFGLALFPRSTQKYHRASGQDMFNVSDTFTYLDYYGTAAGGSYPPLILPYAGSYGAGTDPTAGPLIPVTPESAGRSSTYLGSFNDSVEIKSKLLRLRGEAGIEFVKPITERLDVYVAPQLVLEFIDMHAERSEIATFTDGSGASATIGSRMDSKHKMTVVPGVLLTTGADYCVSDNWYAGASVGWEWLAEEPSMNVGPDKVQFDLGGGEFSLYVGRRF